MTDPAFITNLKDKTEHFLQKLIEHRETGKNTYESPLDPVSLHILCRHVNQHSSL